MNQQSGDTALDDQAFALVRETHDSPGPDADTTLAEWCERSPRHRRACERARAEWELLGQAPVRTLAPTQRVRLFLERKGAYIQEHPGIGAGVALMLLCGVLLLQQSAWLSAPRTVTVSASGSVAVSDTSREYSTAYGRRASHTLPDGSVVTLNWDSRLSLHYDESSRRVSLHRGEAIFTVAPNPDRPFIVSVDNVEVRAVGTEFSVHRLGANHGDVTVNEGIVEVSTGEPQRRQHVELHINQSVVAHELRIDAIENTTASDLNAWREGMLVFDGSPLPIVLAELDRYTAYSIRSEALPDPEARVTATYFIDDADDALRSLLQLFGLQAESRGSTVLIRPATPTPPGDRP